MSTSPRSAVARIGRSYPRARPEVVEAQPAPRSRRYRVVAGVLAVLSAIGLGWLLAR